MLPYFLTLAGEYGAGNFHPTALTFLSSVVGLSVDEVPPGPDTYYVSIRQELSVRKVPL